ncbi:MAG TPA: hypothetical protein VN924_18455 [Bryobacteraceae bacterium]|nr:hypothetical protein [Bryobacteraceae bacterium]
MPADIVGSIIVETAATPPSSCAPVIQNYPWDAQSTNIQFVNNFVQDSGGAERNTLRGSSEAIA